MKSIYVMKLQHMFNLWDHFECEDFLRCFTEKENRFAIYGAGAFGTRMVSALKEHFGVSPYAFIDRRAEEETFSVNDIPVYTPSKLFAEAGNIPIGVALKSYFIGIEKKEVNELLRMAGFSQIANIWTADAYYDGFLYSSKIDREKTLHVIDMLYDSVSKEQYYAYIYSRIWKTPFYAPTYAASASYCENGLYWLDESDHVLDCGAYDGDTAWQLIYNYPDLRCVTLVEPDETLFKRLCSRMQSVSQKDIRAIQKAVGNVNGDVGFISTASVASRIDNHAESKVSCCRIDDIEFEVPPSFIKMDIEGAELDALHGAERTIAEYMPILAVSCYHKASDIYDIPLYIKGLKPDYRFFFRKYCGIYNTWDFILFAIPPERLLH